MIFCMLFYTIDDRFQFIRKMKLTFVAPSQFVKMIWAGNNSNSRKAEILSRVESCPANLYFLTWPSAVSVHAGHSPAPGQGHVTRDVT